MSLDLITEIQASPKAFADKLTTMRAALDKAMGDWQETLKHNGSLIESNQMLRAALEAVTAQLAAVTAERDAALKDASWWAVKANEKANERDTYKAEADRLAAALNKTAERVELWIHDTDQFSPRTSAEDIVIQDGQLEELAQIVKALRGQPAPEQNKAGPALNRPGGSGVTSAINGRADYTAPEAQARCPKCGHPMINHDDVIGCFEYECECDVTAPAQGQE